MQYHLVSLEKLGHLQRLFDLCQSAQVGRLCDEENKKLKYVKISILPG